MFIEIRTYENENVEIDLTDWAEPDSECNLDQMFEGYDDEHITIKDMEKFIRED
jgi:hypothetical protein